MRKFSILMLCWGAIVSLILSCGTAPVNNSGRQPGNTEEPGENAGAGAQVISGESTGPKVSGAVTSMPQVNQVTTEPADGNDGGVVANVPNDYEAEEAIERYAKEMLGIEIAFVTSVSQVGEISMPTTAEASVDAVVDMAGVTYAAVLQNGAASLSLGQGTISGDLEADIQSASLGVYILLIDGEGPANEDEALSLIKATYPGIAYLPYALKEVSRADTSLDSMPANNGGNETRRPSIKNQGDAKTYTFIATSRENEIDVRSGEARMFSSGILVGAGAKGPGKVMVFAVVGKGDLASAVN